MNPSDALSRISGAKVLVLGDVMLDRYWLGSADRISPEAPVPIVSLHDVRHVLGGAANVAANILGLGGKPTLVGVVGEDEAGAVLRSLLVESGIGDQRLLTIVGRPTTVKTRVLASKQQIARIDSETREALNDAQEAQVLSTLPALIADCDIVLLSDYAKGTLTSRIVTEIIEDSKQAGKRVIVDPKGRDYGKYRGASLLTPNTREAVEAFAIGDSKESSLISGARLMIAALGLDSMLITRGEMGMLLVGADGQPFSIEASAQEVFDVTGAGDTVIATLACALAAGLSEEESVRLANRAAAAVIQHIGTTAINHELLM